MAATIGQEMVNFGPLSKGLPVQAILCIPAAMQQGILYLRPQGLIQ